MLDRHVDVQGKEDENVLRLIYLNSYFEAGIKSPLDDAILKYARPKISEYVKVDEIPFDFNRKRLSVVVRHGDEHLLITKGEAESVFAICKTVTIDGSPQPFDDRPAGSSGGDLPEAEFRRLPRSRGGRAEGGEARCLQGGGRARYDTGGIRGIP